MTPNPKIQELIVSMGIIPESEHYEIAERVIQECALVAFHNVVNLSSIADAEDVEANIKEHFGVEE